MLRYGMSQFTCWLLVSVWWLETHRMGVGMVAPMRGRRGGRETGLTSGQRGGISESNKKWYVMCMCISSICCNCTIHGIVQFLYDS